jgi:hypothetical protein
VTNRISTFWAAQTFGKQRKGVDEGRLAGTQGRCPQSYQPIQGTDGLSFIIGSRLHRAALGTGLKDARCRWMPSRDRQDAISTASDRCPLPGLPRWLGRRLGAVAIGSTWRRPGRWRPRALAGLPASRGGDRRQRDPRGGCPLCPRPAPVQAPSSVPAIGSTWRRPRCRAECEPRRW